MPRKDKPFAIDLLFRALADPTRLRLANLRRAGIAAARRQGRWIHYRLVVPGDAVASSILKEPLKHLRERPDMRRDFARLGSACCKPRAFELPEKAPQPSLASLPVR